jgi:hypothetical protein
MTSTYRRTTEITLGGVTATVAISGHGPNRYRVQVDLGRRASIAVQIIDKPQSGTISAAAQRVAEVALNDALAQSMQSHTYVRVDGLPVYAAEDVTMPMGMVEAAYWMDYDRHVPVTVYRVTDATDIEVTRFIADVTGQDFSEYRNHEFGPAAVTVTSDVLAATSGGREVCDGVTALAVDRAEEHLAV